MQGFGAWAERYTAIFGLTSEADALMVSAWQAVFEAACYTAAELEAATDWLAGNAGPMTRPEHRPGIQARIRTARAERQRALAEQNDREEVSCDLCGGSGRVIVPYLGRLGDGIWAAVTCRCLKGERIAASYAGDEDHPRRILRLADYELRNPEWFGQLKRREQELAARGRADQLAAHAEKIRPVGEAVDERIKRAREQPS